MTLTTKNLLNFLHTVVVYWFKVTNTLQPYKMIKATMLNVISCTSEGVIVSSAWQGLTQDIFTIHHLSSLAYLLVLVLGKGQGFVVSVH